MSQADGEYAACQQQIMVSRMSYPQEWNTKAQLVRVRSQAAKRTPHVMKVVQHCC